MRTWLVAIVVLCVAFAGCASKGGDKDDDATSGTGTATGSASGTASLGSKPGSGSTSSTSTGSASQNRPPTIQVTLGNVSGLTVVFDLNGTDPDGDALSWTLSFGDATANATGSSLPANATHAYAAAGNYSAIFAVSDGKASINTTYAVNLTAASTAAGAPIVITTSWAIGAPNGGSYELQTCEAGPGEGVTTAYFQMPAEASNRPFSATITGTPQQAIVSWWIFMSKASCGTGASDYDTFTVDGSGPITGTVLDGWVLGATAASGGTDLQVTITIG